jgi:hypothetical protein
MTRYQNPLDAGAQGVQITASNSAGSGSAFTSQFGAGVATYDSGSAFQGARGMLTESAASIAGFNSDFTATSTAGFSFEFQVPTVPTADYHIGRLTDSSGARLVSFHINSAGKLRIVDATSSTSTVWTATDALTAGTWYRLELYAKAGTSTTTGEIRGAYFAAGSTTTIGSFASTSVNAGTGTPFARFLFGRITSSAIQAKFDSIVWETDGTGLPGPYVAAATPLGTPVVTAGARTDPTTVGGTDGKQVVTWPAVSGAVSYEAWRATAASPTQGDFTRIAQGVTSPYEFTGLAGGNYSLGIKAKA